MPIADGVRERGGALNDGLLFLSENEEDCFTKGNARSSGDELVDRIRIPDDDRIEMRGTVQEVIDYGRYIVTVGSKTGVITIWWRKTEKSENWTKYLRAVESMRRRFKRKKLTLKTSNSYSLSVHTIAQIIEKARRWQQWHSAWVYNFRHLISANKTRQVL